MDAKIQELTQKILTEGVEKGKKEADRILEEANNQREIILRDAKQEAEKIISEAKKRALDLKENTESEIKMFASQSLESLKTSVTNLISEKVVTNAVQKSTEDPDFLKKVILNMAKSWKEDETMVIQATDAEGLKAYFLKEAKELLDKGIKIEEVNGKSVQFNILPSDGSYKLSFGEQEFISYFKEFLRPKLIEMLF